MTIANLEKFFNSIELPKTIELSKYEKINDVKLFVDSHIETLKFNTGNNRFLPYYERLLKLKNILENEIV